MADIMLENKNLCIAAFAARDLRILEEAERLGIVEAIDKVTYKVRG